MSAFVDNTDKLKIAALTLAVENCKNRFEFSEAYREEVMTLYTFYYNLLISEL